MIPHPAELDVMEKYLLILDDCFLGPQNKAETYYKRGRYDNCDTFYTELLSTTPSNDKRKRPIYYTFSTRC